MPEINLAHYKSNSLTSKAKFNFCFLCSVLNLSFDVQRRESKGIIPLSPVLPATWAGVCSILILPSVSLQVCPVPSYPPMCAGRKGFCRAWRKAWDKEIVLIILLLIPWSCVQICAFPALAFLGWSKRIPCPQCNNKEGERVNDEGIKERGLTLSQVPHDE